MRIGQPGSRWTRGDIRARVAHKSLDRAEGDAGRIPQQPFAGTGRPLIFIAVLARV